MRCINAITRLDFQLDFFFLFLFHSIIVRNGNQSSSSPTCTQNADYVINVGESGSDFPSAAFRYRPPWWLSRLFYWIKKRLWRFLLIHRTEKEWKKKTISHTQTGAIQAIGPFLYNITTANESNERLFIVNCLMKRKKIEKEKKVGGNFIFSISQEK